jgi:hypothetical protein
MRFDPTNPQKIPLPLPVAKKRRAATTIAPAIPALPPATIKPVDLDAIEFKPAQPPAPAPTNIVPLPVAPVESVFVPRWRRNAL